MSTTNEFLYDIMQTTIQPEVDSDVQEVTEAKDELAAMQRGYDLMVAQDEPPTSKGWAWAGEVLAAAQEAKAAGELTGNTVSDLIGNVCMSEPGVLINSRRLGLFMIKLKLYGDALQAEDTKA